MERELQDLNLDYYEFERDQTLKTCKELNNALEESFAIGLNNQEAAAIRLKRSDLEVILSLGIKLPKSIREFESQPHLLSDKNALPALHIRRAISLLLIKFENTQKATKVFFTIARDNRGEWQGILGGCRDENSAEIEKLTLLPELPIEGLGGSLLVRTEEGVGEADTYISGNLYHRSANMTAFFKNRGYIIRGYQNENGVSYVGKKYNIH